MKQNRIYITGILLLSFLSGKAQKIEELPAVPLQIGYEKTLHLIFPIEVKYYSIGGDYVIGEKVGNCPEIIRLKAAEENSSFSRPESPMWTMAVQMWRLKRPREWTTSWQ